MTYQMADGTKLVLAHHTPEEWADVRREQLLKVGCSETYARRIARRIRAAGMAPEEEA